MTVKAVLVRLAQPRTHFLGMVGGGNPRTKQNKQGTCLLAGEMAQCFGVLAVLAKTTGSIPGVYMVARDHL